MIRLVRVPTNVNDAVLRNCLRDLPAAERPARLRAQQRRHVVARAVLRRCLAASLGMKPEHVPLQRQAGGKPVLAQSLHAPVHFSLSYSGDDAVLALAPAPVGVDIEGVIPDDVAQVARHVCTPEEQARLHAASDPVEDSARRIGLTFLDIWTAKEAVLKFLGLGLRVEPSRFCVPPAAPHFQAVCVRALAPHAPSCVVANWRLRETLAVAVSVACAPSAFTAIAWETWEHDGNH